MVTMVTIIYSESKGLVTDNDYCLVKIIEQDERIIAAVQFEIKLFAFFTSLNSSLIIFIRTYTVNYRNALDRLHVRMNIVLFRYRSDLKPLSWLHRSEGGVWESSTVESKDKFANCGI